MCVHKKFKRINQNINRAILMKILLIILCIQYFYKNLFTTQLAIYVPPFLWEGRGGLVREVTSILNH